MIKSKRRIRSVFMVLLFTLALMLPEFFPFASPQTEMEDEISTEESVTEKNDVAAKTDNMETVAEELRWSIVFYAKKFWLIAEDEVKEIRTALELAAEKEIESCEPYLAAYYKLFRERWNGHDADSNQGIRFRLVYMDGDEIPELLLMEPFSHATGVEVYTYFEDKLIEVGEFGSTGRMQYLEKEGMIHGGFFNMGASFDGFYRLEKGGLETVCTLENCDGAAFVEDQENFYTVDDVSVSKEAYDARWDELWSDDFITIGYDDGISVKDILDLKGLLLQEAEGLKSGLVWKG